MIAILIWIPIWTADSQTSGMPPATQLGNIS
jgi:hypothetical protein